MNFLKDVQAYCNEKRYKLVWFCRDIEHVYLKERIEAHQKKNKSFSFMTQKKIRLINANDLMAGCQKAEGDIENWDVKFWLVREVTINEYLQGKEPYKLTRKEAKKLVEAFNSVKEEDIYWDLSHGEALSGPFYGNVEIKLLTGKTISISYNPCGWIDYNEFHYFTNYQLEYYRLRNLYRK